MGFVIHSSLIIKNVVFVAAFLVAFLFTPQTAHAENINTITSVSNAGRTISEGTQHYRSDFNAATSNWVFNFSWPYSVGNANALFVIAHGTFGNLEGGTPQNGVNFGANYQTWPAGDNVKNKSIGFIPGGTSMSSGTYTVMIASVDAFNTAGTMEWFASGGVSGNEPNDYALLTFEYIAGERPPDELVGAVQSVVHGGRTIFSDDEVLRKEIGSNENSFWIFNFNWPNSVPNLQAGFYIFRGTFGDVEGGSAVEGESYAGNLQVWPAGQNTIQKSFGLPLLRDSQTKPSEYTVMLAERHPLSASLQEEADWFASGGTEGRAPKKYSLLTFNYKKYKECCSSVVFLPGIKATELYENENKRWLPGLFNIDAERLAMTEAGESINALLVGEPIKNVTVATVKLVEIYGEFFDFLESLKGTVIADWKALPYDWRFDVFDVVSNTQNLKGGIALNIENEVRRIAAESDTGKVTVVAHSNGGLVGKALISELGDDANLVDQLIMVGTPQLGTPSAIGAFLHGHNQSLPGGGFPGLLMSQSIARELSKNMLGAYGLLPTGQYLEKILDPVVTFDPGSETLTPFRAAYGDFIGGSAANAEREKNDLYSFLLGVGDGRSDSTSGNLLTPIILNNVLLDNSLITRNALDTWQPPTSVEVAQVIGWGVDTVKTLHYQEHCSTGLGCVLTPRPQFTVEGDETVVWKSAGSLDEEPIYFFNLQSGGNYTHASLLAAPQVQELLEGIIKKDMLLPSDISETKPTPNPEKRLYVSVHSPITVGIRDLSNRFTGVIDSLDSNSNIPLVIEEVPGTSYSEFGEGKYVGFYADQVYEIIMEGTGSGTFTLEIQETEQDTILETVTYSNVPVSSDTQAILAIQNVSNKGDLEVDIDGDGEIDQVVAPDGSGLSLEDIIAILKEKIQNLDSKEKLKTKLLKYVEKFEKKIEKKKQKNQKIIDKFQKKVANKTTKGKIDIVGADEILALVEELETQSYSLSFDPSLLNEIREKIENADMSFALKWTLLNRIDKLEKTTALTNTLSRVTKAVMRKGEKGKIADEDVEEILSLLEQLEIQL